MSIKNIQTKIFLIISIILISNYVSIGQVQWDQVLYTQAEHDAWIPGTNHPHFVLSWQTTDSWSGNEGYYRWTISTAEFEDDDGYYIEHPETDNNSVYLSWIGRVGPTWADKLGNHDYGMKWVMFYPQQQTNPRPTMFWEKVRGNSGNYGVVGADIEAGGNGIDEFGEAYPDVNYPDHTYKEIEGTGHSQWYYYVVGLVGDFTYIWIYSQDGTLAGGAHGNDYYCRSAQKSPGWNETWKYARLLAYIEQTDTGDPDSYRDIAHISVHNTMPDVPEGFLITSTETTKEDYIPCKFYLSANYPNPFNPAAKIIYSLPTSEFVQIKVYDVLGKEICTLVNEEKSAGSYEAEFNGSTLSGGVYFYNMKAGSFLKSRKLILLK